MWDTEKQPPQYEASSSPYQQSHIQNALPYVQAEVHNVPVTSIAPYPNVQQAQAYNIPATSIPIYPVAQPVKQNEGWWSRNHKNKPQSNSVGAVSLIFISGGMNMAWQLGFPPIVQTNYSITDHIICSWFIGGIIGAVVGAFTCNRVPKKSIVGFASVLIAICGILQVSDPDSYNAVLSSRYLNGIAVGLIFPMTFVLVGEEVVKPLRGMNAASIDTACFSCGILIQIIYSASWSNSPQNNFRAIQLSGILNIIYGVLSFIIGSLYLIESPLLYLASGDEQLAIESLRRLQRPFTITYETYELLEEHKRYLEESNERNLAKNAVYGIPALVKLCFYRSFMALGFSYFVNFAFTYSSSLTTPLQKYPYIIYAVARWLGPIITTFTLDSRGRKSSMISGFFICTILAFVVGGIFDDPHNYVDYNSLNTVKYILIFFQFFTSISMVSSSAYLSEAFPFAVKPYYVAIVFIVEMLVQIIIIRNRDFYIKNVFHISEYFLSLGSLSLVFLALAIFVMPETKCYSLLECLPKFRQINNFRN